MTDPEHQDPVEPAAPVAANLLANETASQPAAAERTLADIERASLRQNLRTLTEDVLQVSPLAAHIDGMMPQLLTTVANLVGLKGLAVRQELGPHGSIVVAGGQLHDAAYARAERRERTDLGSRTFVSTPYAWGFRSLTPTTCVYGITLGDDETLAATIDEASEMVRVAAAVHWLSLMLRAKESHASVLYDLHRDPVALIDKNGSVYATNKAFRRAVARNDTLFRQTGREQLEFTENDLNRRFRKLLAGYFRGSARVAQSEVWRELAVSLTPSEERGRVLVTLKVPQVVTRDTLFPIGQALGLSRRQIDCAASLFACEHRDDYARRCNISGRTVAWTERKVREALGVNSRSEIVATLTRYL